MNTCQQSRSTNLRGHQKGGGITRYLSPLSVPQPRFKDSIETEEQKKKKKKKEKKLTIILLIY
jgi:hypothetical protein